MTYRCLIALLMMILSVGLVCAAPIPVVKYEQPTMKMQLSSPAKLLAFLESATGSDGPRGGGMLSVIPKFKEMFTSTDQELPLISQIVFGTSEFFLARPLFLPNVFFLFVVFGIIVVLFNIWGKTNGGRNAIDKIKLRMPILGDIQRKSAVSRFSRTLGTLVTSGVPILQALNITRDTAGNVVISSAIEKVHEAVKEGETIVTPLQASGVFPNMVISMVDVGEETGQLPEMLLKVADVYDDEVDNAVTALTSILEPIMIVILALIVGSVVFALFLPLIKMISTMGNQ